MEDNVNWLAKEFASLNLHDRRLTYRFINVASKLMRAPSKTINQAMGEWSEAKAAYRLFDNKKLDRDMIIHAHKKKTLERINDFEQDEIFLAIQDSTTLNYTHHPKTKGIKKLHKQQGFEREMQGFHVHNLMIMTADGIPLGLLRQDVFQNDILNRNIKHFPITQKNSYSM